MKIIYSTEATASGGGRTGHSATANGRVSVDLSVPKEMGGDNGPGTNPEELFATGYAACYLGALNGVARAQKIKLPEGTTVSCKVSFADREDGVGYTIVAALSAHIPGYDQAQTADIMSKAHAICPYSDLITRAHDVELTPA